MPLLMHIELSDFSLAALFTEDGKMRPSSNNDLAIMSMMLKSAEHASSVRGSALVVDGGMLLHSIDYPCKKGSTFGTIADAYVTLLQVM